MVGLRDGVHRCPHMVIGRKSFDASLTLPDLEDAVDCADRGSCDVATGACLCDDGFHGDACGERAADDAAPLEVGPNLETRIPTPRTRTHPP